MIKRTFYQEKMTVYEILSLLVMIGGIGAQVYTTQKKKSVKRTDVEGKEK